MKLKYTQAKKARRASGFLKRPSSRHQSKKRMAKRIDMQPMPKRIFGYPLLRTQRLFFKKDQFGQKVYKTILHAKMD